MLKLKPLQQTGDTIVEVLIVLAILASAFSIGYSIAYKSLSNARNAEEHSQALQYANAQAELLRQAAPHANAPSSQIFAPGKFCLKAGDPSPQRVAHTSPDCHKGPNGRYEISIEWRQHTNLAEDAVPDDLFSINVEWESLVRGDKEHELLTYKVHEIIP